MEKSDVRKFIKEKGSVTVPELQLRFSLGYKEARELMTKFEADNIVGFDGKLRYIYKMDPKIENDRGTKTPAIGLEKLKIELDIAPPPYRQLVEYCVKNQTINIPAIQAIMGVGYHRALSSIEWLKRMKVVEFNNVDGYNVLISAEDYFSICCDDKDKMNDDSETDDVEEDAPENSREDEIDKIVLDNLFNIRKTLRGESSPSEKDAPAENNENNNNYALLAIGSKFEDASDDEGVKRWDLLLSTLGKPKNAIRECLKSLPSVICCDLSEEDAEDYAKKLLSVDILTTVVRLNDDGSLNEARYFSEDKETVACNNTIEWVVKIKDAKTKRGAIDILNDIYNWLDDKSLPQTRAFLKKARKKIEAMPLKEYKELRNKSRY